jgi:hypothetical protein
MGVIMQTFQSHPFILRDPFVKGLNELVYIMSPLTNFDFCVFYHNDTISDDVTSNSRMTE